MTEGSAAAPTVATIGCSGPIGDRFLRGFLDRGASVRVLARDPGEVRRRHPDVEVVPGSMLVPADVSRAVDGADAAFVLTPMGVRNDPATEIEAGRAVADGAAAGGCRHLVYNSVLGADHRRGVGILDAKYEIEPILRASGVPVSILRCGTFMEDIFDPRLAQLRKGRFVFPITPTRRFTYTSQRDVAPFVVDELIGKDEVLDGPLNFVAPGTFSLTEVERVLSEAAATPIRTAPKVPAYYLVQAAGPIVRLRGGRFSSIVPLLRWFEHNGYTDDGPTVGERFPGFPMTTLSRYARDLFRRQELSA